jgi:hypothetical protein
MRRWQANSLRCWWLRARWTRVYCISEAPTFTGYVSCRGFNDEHPGRNSAMWKSGVTLTWWRSIHRLIVLALDGRRLVGSHSCVRRFVGHIVV